MTTGTVLKADKEICGLEKGAGFTRLDFNDWEKILSECERKIKSAWQG